MKFTAKNNNNVATKDDIKAIRKEMVTMDNKIDKLAIDSLDTHERLQKIEETMATKDDISRVLDAVDMAMGQYQEIKKANPII